MASASPDPALAIGLDLGGTKIAGGLVDPADGRLLTRRVVPTAPERGGDAVLADAVELADALAAEAASLEHTVAAVGLGVPELVGADGRVRSTHRFDWTRLDVPAHFAPLAPARVESDVRAAALAEARVGAGRPFRVFAYVTVGTGISSCLVLDGRPFPGARGGALVLASAPVASVCAACGARTSQTLEDWASGPALVDRYAQATGRTPARAEEVTAAAARGDEAARATVRAAGEALGAAVGFLVNVLDPEAVVVGGGLGSVGGPYREALVAAARAHVWDAEARELPILPAALGVDSGLIGAALVAWEHARTDSTVPGAIQTGESVGHPRRPPVLSPEGTS